MIVRQNLHMHSLYDDGKDNCRDMLSACKKAGLKSAGISIHSPLPFENDWAARPEVLPAFLREMEQLKQDFDGQLEVLCGIELDVLSADMDLSSYDYVIGSVHHLPGMEIPLSIDNIPEETEQVINTCFSGSADAAAEAYFGELVKLAKIEEVDICGHFDLLTKFNDHSHFFDTGSRRYRDAALSAIEAFIAAGKIFEVNTGAISRGWRKDPYPEDQWLCEIQRRGGSVTFSSDAHCCEHVTAAFEETCDRLRRCGFQEVMVLHHGNWTPYGIEE